MIVGALSGYVLSVFSLVLYKDLYKKNYNQNLMMSSIELSYVCLFVVLGGMMNL
jgi:NhaP-type Na+/H+ or K+/H+ antiporter